jgi:hypothetical protein
VGRRLVAWSLWLAAIGNCAAGMIVALVVTRPPTLAMLAEGAAALAFLLIVATIGLVLALRRPANPIGWLYATAALVASLTAPWRPWVDELVDSGRPLPLAARVAAVAMDFEWAPSVALGITLPFLLLPDGRLRSPRWRVAAAASMIAAIIVPLAGSLIPGQLLTTPITNPLGLRGTPGAVAAAVAYICTALYWASLVAALVCVVLRFRDSRGIEHQQLRWVAAAPLLQ